jgi:hypothetical protein
MVVSRSSVNNTKSEPWKKLSVNLLLLLHLLALLTSLLVSKNRSVVCLPFWHNRDTTETQQLQKGEVEVRGVQSKLKEVH